MERTTVLLLPECENIATADGAGPGVEAMVEWRGAHRRVVAVAVLIGGKMAIIAFRLLVQTATITTFPPLGKVVAVETEITTTAVVNLLPIIVTQIQHHHLRQATTTPTIILLLVMKKITTTMIFDGVKRVIAARPLTITTLTHYLTAVVAAGEVGVEVGNVERKGVGEAGVAAEMVIVTGCRPLL